MGLGGDKGGKVQESQLTGGNEMHDDLIQLGGEIGTKIHYGFLVVSVLLVLIVWELSKIRKKL